MNRGGGLSWSWIAIGTVIMFCLSFLAGLVAALILVRTGAVASGAAGGGELSPGPFAMAALVSFLSFVVGGYVVGLRSPGRTVLEPGISAALAVAVTLLIGGTFSLGILLAAGLIPFVGGVVGGLLGERAQRRRLVA